VVVLYVKTVLKSPTFRDMKKHPELEFLSHITFVDRIEYFRGNACDFSFGSRHSTAVSVSLRVKRKMFRHRPAGERVYAPWKMIFPGRPSNAVLHFTSCLRLRHSPKQPLYGIYRAASHGNYRVTHVFFFGKRAYTV